MKEKVNCKYCGKSFNMWQKCKFHQYRCPERLQRNPMSLKEHIKEIRAHIHLKITHASFRKLMTKLVIYGHLLIDFQSLL